MSLHRPPSRPRRAVLGQLAATCASVALPAVAQAPVTLQVWTWHPDEKSYEPAVRRFEALNPGLRIQLSVMDSKSLQEKVPLALTTGEAVDVVGIQPQMAGQLQTYLQDLQPLLDSVQPGWQQSVVARDLLDCKRSTAGVLKYLSLMRIGAMLLYYNAELFDRLRLPLPTTLDAFAALVPVLRARAPGVLPVALNGRDSWTMREVFWTLVAQHGDYVERFLFDGAPLDAQPVQDGLRTLKRWFDSGVFDLDVLDFEYGQSQALFTSGRAATYVQGSWESWLLSPRLRREKQVHLDDVGAVALPVSPGGRPGLCSFVEVGAAIARQCRHPLAAAKWIAFMHLGEGPQLLARRNLMIFSKKDVPVAPGLFDRPAGAAGDALLREMVAQPLAVRLMTTEWQRFTGVDRAISQVIHGSQTPAHAAQALQQQWLVHQRKTRLPR